MNNRTARGEIYHEKDSPETIPIIDIEVGDTCKFKGTRDKGYRRIMQMDLKNFFCRVVEFKKGEVEFTNFTSTHQREKLSKVWRNGQWLKVIH